MKKNPLFCSLVLLGLSCSYAFANVAFVKSAGHNPWGDDSENPGSHESAMNTVFGNERWDNLSFQNADAAVLFSSAYTFIYLEGSDDSVNTLKAFLIGNNDLIESWVSNGGRLFINSAPNEGDGMDLGFGLHLTYDTKWSVAAGVAMAADSSHVIFNGPHGTTGGSFSGGWFSHAIITGNGLTALINGELKGGGTGIVLGELEWGNGSVVVSGMTSAQHQTPRPETYALWANTLAYAAAIPEPATYAIWGSLGLLGLVAMRRRRQ